MLVPLPRALAALGRSCGRTDGHERPVRDIFLGHSFYPFRAKNLQEIQVEAHF